ncbi:hypothetical protein ACVXZ4_14590 [Lacisediminihabitans sp. FW035]
MRNRSGPSSWRRTTALTAALAVTLVLGGISAAGIASADDIDGGSGLTVTVGPTDQNGGDSALGNTGSGSNGGTGAGSGVSGGVGAGNPGPTPSLTPSSTPKPGDLDLGGVLYLSGVTSEYVWSINPAHSAVLLHLTLRNVSKTTFSSSARFWIDTTLGNTVSDVKGVRIDRLRPNETRIVTVLMDGLGQWTVLHAHATVTPPKSVDGVTLQPVTRDSYIFVPPLLAGSVGLLGLGLLVLGRLVWALRLAPLTKGIA